MMITPALVRPTRCSRSARASARFACSCSALLGFGGFLAHGGGGTRGPRPLRPLNGRHFGPPNDQFHDKLSRLYGSFGSSIGTSRVSARLSSEYEAIRRRGSAYSPAKLALSCLEHSSAHQPRNALSSPACRPPSQTPSAPHRPDVAGCGTDGFLDPGGYHGCPLVSCRGTFNTRATVSSLLAPPLKASAACWMASAIRAADMSPRPAMTSRSLSSP